MNYRNMLEKLESLAITGNEKISENTQKVLFNDDFSFVFENRIPHGCSIERVTGEDPFMTKAFDTRYDSGCFKHQTGAVIVKDGEVIVAGANEGELKTWCERDKQGYGSGEGYHLCKEVCHQIHHAERMAVKRALENSIDLTGAKLYLSGHWWACALCWRWLMEVGIKTIVLDEDADKKYVKPESLFK